LISANEKYFAVPWQGGGGPFYINQLDKPGKIDASPSLFQGHAGSILDLDFSPFDTEVSRISVNSLFSELTTVVCGAFTQFGIS
jgi:hypothetical protein